MVKVLMCKSETFLHGQLMCVCICVCSVRGLSRNLLIMYYSDHARIGK